MGSYMPSVFRVAPCIALLGFMAGAHAQTYPNKSVRVIASVLPGDTCDTLVRLLGFKMGEKLGQQFIIDNRVGASGMLGHGIVAQAAPDGYTLGCGNGGSLAIVPHAFKKVPYDALKDFTPIALMATNFMALAVGGGSQWRSVNDLVQHAKQNPGKVTFGSNGEGAFLHFATEMFRSTAGFSYLHIPFKGFPQLAGDLVSGRLDASFGSFPAVLPFTQGGRVRILGIARDKRLPNYPDIPTIAESVPGYVSGGWFGIVGPAGIPRNIVTLLNREANAAMKLPEIRDKLVPGGLDLFTESPEYFAKFMRDDHARYGRIAKEIGLKAQ
jgi:tripartite-type tricarboxylate transporter receptor subunit TctC